MKGVMIFLVLTLVVLMAGECLGGDTYGSFDNSDNNNYQHGNSNNNGGPRYGGGCGFRRERSLPGSEDDGSK